MINRIIFCVETTRQANTDYAYIRETIRHYYADDKKNVIRRVCMESKTRYNSKAVEENIEKECAFSKHNHVIYCIDTDDWDTSADDRRLMEKIQAYCRSKGYDFVFFCRDVEDVYWGKRVLKTEKTRQWRSSEAHMLLKG